MKKFIVITLVAVVGIIGTWAVTAPSWVEWDAFTAEEYTRGVDRGWRSARATTTGGLTVVKRDVTVLLKIKWAFQDMLDSE